MPYISTEKRDFSICGNNYTIPETISFHKNCEIEFNQKQADTLYTHILNVIDILDKICPGEYWAVGGTLLGTIRWGQILTWDDDSDFGITMKGYSLILDYLESSDSLTKYEFIESANGLKVYFGDLCVGDIFVCDYINNKFVYSGPVIDGVSTFYTHKYIFNQIKFRETDIFPLIRKPFGTKTIPCPKNYTRILNNNYRPGVLTTIIPPVINNIHSFVTKEFFIESFDSIKKNHIKYPNSCDCVFLHLLTFQTPIICKPVVNNHLYNLFIFRVLFFGTYFSDGISFITFCIFSFRFSYFNPSNFCNLDFNILK